MARTIIVNRTAVRRLRLRLGWSQCTLAKRSGCSLRTISNLENGSRTFLETVRLVAQALGVRPAELFLQPAENESVQVPACQETKASHIWNPPQRILWVDDHPSNISHEACLLQNEGIEVIRNNTTLEAMRALRRKGKSIDAVISDMGRIENKYEPEAGLELLYQIQESCSDKPFFMYTSSDKADQADLSVKRLGGIGGTDSSVILFQMIGRVFGG